MELIRRLMDRVAKSGRRRQAAIQAAEDEARTLVLEKGRVGALFAVDELRNRADRDPAARRKADLLQQAIHRIVPHPSRADTATRMHYRM